MANQPEMQNQVAELVRKAETLFTSGKTTISQYVDVSLYDDINQIDAYLNSKHISGDTDSLGRDKPFFNIVIANRNIWFRATDLDRKNVRVKATKSSDVINSFLANVHLQNFMRRSRFGKFLNEWGLTLAGYGSSIIKCVEQDSELHCGVISWNSVIVDSIDFDSNPVIEILELTPSQLRKKESYDQDLVEKLIDAKSSREVIGGQKKDTKADYIKIYEVHGELPLSYLTDEKEDEKTYVQQMHVVSFVAGKESKDYEDFTLYSGKEKQNPYMITHLLETEGYTLGMGAVKSLFESQWMVNHSIKAVKDQLDLASKLVFQTADSNFTGQNLLSNIESGDIMIHKENMPLTNLANSSHDITSLLAFKNQWQALSREISSTPDILRGENMPSGTAFRQAAIIQSEAHSNFEMMVENKGLYLEEMLRRFIIPHIKKKMNTADEITATLDTYGVDKIDERYIKNESVKRTNQRLVQSVLRGYLPSPEDQTMMINQETIRLKEELENMGNQRFYTPLEVNWIKQLKDLEWELEVEITPETTDKQATFDTLTNIFQTIANPATRGVLQTPEGKMLFNKILEETGKVSPVEMKESSALPVGGGVGGQQIVGAENIQ